MTEILSHIDSGVMTLTFNRVDKKNSLTAAMYAALADAVDQISAYQALVGAQENALGYQNDFVDTTSTAVSTAYGNIVNYDLAEETTLLASAQIKQNGAMAMLAQANMSSDMVSYLLKQYIS